jgi:hypothetical protein
MAKFCNNIVIRGKTYKVNLNIDKSFIKINYEGLWKIY